MENFGKNFKRRLALYGALFGIFAGRLLYMYAIHTPSNETIHMQSGNINTYPAATNAASTRIVRINRFKRFEIDLEQKRKEEETERKMEVLIIGMFASAIIAFLDFLLQLFSINRTAFIRLTAVLSAIWILLMAIAYDIFRSTYHINKFLLVGLLPVLIIWGLIWAFGIYKRKDTQ